VPGLAKLDRQLLDELVFVFPHPASDPNGQGSA
jgi:hypothetical protein